MIRIALRMLVGDKAKYTGIVFGVTMAALLMSHQVTIFTGLMARTWSVIQDLGSGPGAAQLIIADPATEFVEDVRPISDTSAERVRAVPGVEWAVGLMRVPIRVKLADGRFRTCIVMGLDDATLVGGPPKMVEGSLDDLRTPDGVIIDKLDAAKLISVKGVDGRPRSPRVGDTIEINDRRAVIVGISHNTRPFISQPIFYTTLSRAREWAPPERRTLSFLLASLTPGTTIEEAKAAILRGTGLAAYTRREFGFKTVGYYVKNTGIPINFGVTVLLGCLVGIAISGQTFYLFIHDNLKNLAALKAMGASDTMLIRMTLAQAALAGVLGYGMGILGTLAFFEAFKGTDLDFKVYWQILALTGVAITIVIALAVVVSLKKVLAIEPAAVFRA
jgi:putative ABC transport system permease protein